MFATTHPSSRARLSGLVLPLANDACPATCSGLHGCGVGGAFYAADDFEAHNQMVEAYLQKVQMQINLIFANSQVFIQ